MNQEIRFCTANDGTRIAYANSGNGPPILRVGTFLTHLEYDWESPIWRPWLDNFSRFHTLYRYDARGCGLSDRHIDDFSINALLTDIESVADAAGLERFALFGMSQGGAAAIWYAAHHPERVSHVIVYGGYLYGSEHEAHNSLDYQQYLISKEILRLGWALDHIGYQQVFPKTLLPEGTTEQIQWLVDLQRASSTGENAARLFEGYNTVNAVKEASVLAAPTLVLHARNDRTVPFDLGRDAAAHVPGARLVPLDSQNHILLPSKGAWPQLWRAIYDFLGVSEAEIHHQESAYATDSRFAELTLRERDVLHLLAKGYRNDEIAQSLVLSSKTVRNYVSQIFSKLGVSSRGEAIVMAHDAGFGSET